jgi:SAM-dependent methyltransferase
MLLKHGNIVIGVEPNEAMRAAAERLLAGYPRFRSVAGTAEATTLSGASVDWVTAAQAFHWFDVERSRAEFRRILRSGGRVALVWNNRLENTPFLAAYEALLQRCSTDYAKVKHQAVESDGSLERFFGGGGFARRTFANRQALDLDGLRGRTLSASYVPRAGQPGHEAIMEALELLFARHARSGRVALEYETRLYVGEMCQPRLHS